MEPDPLQIRSSLSTAQVGAMLAVGCDGSMFWIVTTLLARVVPVSSPSSGVAKH